MLREEEQIWEELFKWELKSGKEKMPDEIGWLRSQFDIQGKPKAKYKNYEQVSSN